ncbi:MAG TPA: hypothetical protein VK403_11820 [Allosphingosinicella sp.]|nr:hypothetical protein [Allosphingosinicella sp.]
MIARGFKSVIWVATVGSAALGCYMVSLRVATERNELARVERQIVEARRDIRSLQTELGTRGRMTQLEEWNAEVLALSAPSSAQFLKDEFTLARLYRNDPTVADRAAQVRLASAQAPAKPAETAKPAVPAVVQAEAERPSPQQPMIHRASFTTAEAPARLRPAAAKPEKPASQRTASTTPATPDKPAPQRTASAEAAKPGTAPDRQGAKSAERTASAEAAKPETAAGRSAAKPAAKAVAAAAKPVREAAAAPRAAKVKGGGGN